MLLRELMFDHRQEIFAICHKRLREQLSSSLDLMPDLENFFDEVLQALRYHDGCELLGAAPTGASGAAVRLGTKPQSAGLAAAQIPQIYGVLSTAIGHVGERYGLSIDADEYRIFNHCVDAGVATSIEHFIGREKSDRDRQVTQTFGDLAYELRGALGNASLAFKLLQDGDSASSGRTAAVLAKNLTRIEALIANKLGTDQLDAALPVELHPVRVTDVLRQLQASAIPERGISVTLAVDESVYVNADETLLTSAVSNLLHNALKFSGVGACVTLSCRADDDGVVIEVEDECGGLAADESARLSSTFDGSDPGEHRGQGLAVAQRAAAAMAGRISLENRPDHGCIFRLTFPPPGPPPASHSFTEPSASEAEDKPPRSRQIVRDLGALVRSPLFAHAYGLR